MYPAPLQGYHAPSTVDAAIKAMADAGEDAMFLGGGMSLMQAIKSRLVRPSVLIDLGGVQSLSGITAGEGGALHIGAMTRYADIARNELLSGPFGALKDAATTVGDRQVRNSGTIGGSLCWNYVASCMPNANLCMQSELVLVSAKCTRVVAIEDFLIGPLETARADDELLTAVRVPPPPPRMGSAYQKWGGNVDALPTIGVAAAVTLDSAGCFDTVRLTIGGILPHAQVFAGAEDVLRGKATSDSTAIDTMLAMAGEGIDLQSDHAASADYRKVLITRLGRDVIASAAARAGESA